MPNNTWSKYRPEPIASFYTEVFAIGIGAKWIAIQNPINEPKLISYYKNLGFTLPDPFDFRNNALYKHIN